MLANDKQVGGSHYRGAVVQHWDYCVANNLEYLPGQITRYISRWKFKAGRQDLEKAVHYADKLLEVQDTFWNRLGFLRRSPRPAQLLDEMTSLYRLSTTEREVFRLAVEYRNLDQLRNLRELTAMLLRQVPAPTTEFYRKYKTPSP